MEREDGLISDVYVQGPHRGEGGGKALVDAALEWFQDRRVTPIHLKTDARNTRGFEFRRKLGFETTVLAMDKLL